MSEKIVYSSTRNSNQGSKQKAGTRQRRGDPQGTAGSRGGEAVPGGPIQAQRAAPGLSLRSLPPQLRHLFRGCYTQGTQAQRDLSFS